MPGAQDDSGKSPVRTDPAKRLYSELTLRSKLRLNSIQKQLKPSFWIPSPLYQSLRDSLKTHVKDLTGMTYVYAAPRRTGKTTAGVAAIDLALRANASPYPCLFLDAGSSLRQNFRKALGVPDTVDDQDFIAFLSASLKPKNDGLPLDKTIYSNTLSQIPPVFVIDNVRVFSKEDNDFIEILYKACFSSRILLFIFTDMEDIANMICGINGKARIQPLPGMFKLEGVDWRIVTDREAPTGQIAVGIEWTAQLWTAKKLSKIVKDRFHDFDWSATESYTGDLAFVKDGDLPDAAMRHASNIITESAGAEFKSALNIIEDPSENDNIG